MTFIDLVNAWFKDQEGKVQARLVVVSTEFGVSSFISNNRPVYAFFLSTGPHAQWMGDVFENHLALRDGRELRSEDPELFPILERYLRESRRKTVN